MLDSSVDPSSSFFTYQDLSEVVFWFCFVFAPGIVFASGLILIS